MSFREQLHAYYCPTGTTSALGSHLRCAAPMAILTGSALLATLALVTIANMLAFSHGSVTAARFGLILILVIAAAAGLALPLRRLTRRRAVGTAEAAFPQFQERLSTFAERDGQDPFIELLAGDALEVAQSAEPKQMVTDLRLWSSLGAGLGAFAILVWMIAVGPGFLGYGASLLWTGPHRDKPALYDLRVTPGNAVVRRHADQMVSALPTWPAVAQRRGCYAQRQSSARVGSDFDAAQGLPAVSPAAMDFMLPVCPQERRSTMSPPERHDVDHFDIHITQVTARGEADSRHLPLPAPGPAPAVRRSRGARR